jgi:transcriptional regulator with XRE-family HTH domain
MDGLKAAIERSGISHATLAAAAKIHPTKLPAIIRGNVSPDYRTGLLLAAALDSSLDILVGADWPISPLPAGDQHPLLRLISAERYVFTDAAGISPSHLSQVIHGKRSLSVRVLARCARAGHVGAHALGVALRDWPPPSP